MLPNYVRARMDCWYCVQGVHYGTANQATRQVARRRDDTSRDGLVAGSHCVPSGIVAWVGWMD